MNNAEDRKVVGRLSLTCAVIDREFAGEQEAIAGSDKAAIVAFGKRSIELAMADLIKLDLSFDGSQTSLEISLATVPDPTNGTPKQ
jgi:hypothetical protein